MKFSLLSTAAILLFASTASAATIFSQTTPAEPRAAFSSQDTPTNQKVADNFTLDGTGPLTVRSLRFIGGYGLTAPPPSTPPLDALPNGRFRVVFFEDIDGSPGTPIIGGEFTIGIAYRRTPTSGPLLNGVRAPLEYLIDLGQGVTLNSGTEYWISVMNDTGPDHFWSWARGSGLLDSETATTFEDIATGPWSVFMNGGMWFELNNHNVPEPTTFNIVTQIAAAAIFLRKRRRK